MHQPTIATVIPTTGRRELQRAIASVLAQTRQVDEIIVVADTDAEIKVQPNQAITIVRVGPGAGGNVARQRGIELASSDVIALLDDDDEWEERRIEKQLSLLPENYRQGEWLVSCYLTACFSSGKAEVWPERAISTGESIPEYVFRKHSVRGGMGFVQASTLLFPRALGLAIPFKSDLRFHQDVNWLNDIHNARPNIALIQAREPLVKHYIRAGTVSKRISARQSVGWGRANLSADKRTLGDFLLTHSLYAAGNSTSISEVLRTCAQAAIYGRPGPAAMIYAIAFVLRFLFFRIVHAGCHAMRGLWSKKCAERLRAALVRSSVLRL